MVYFAGKRVDNGSVEDRLGTAVVENGQDRMAYFPYGAQRSGTSTEVQFATYKRDSTTNLDYAHQRYYSTQIGRFTTPDPKDGSADPQIPQSWNRYAYALGDPINNTDSNGTAIDENGQDYGFIGGTIMPTGFSNYGTNVYPGFGSGGPSVDMAGVMEGYYANSIAPWMTPGVPAPTQGVQNPGSAAPGTAAPGTSTAPPLLLDVLTVLDEFYNLYQEEFNRCLGQEMGNDWTPIQTTNLYQTLLNAPSLNPVFTSSMLGAMQIEMNPRQPAGPDAGINRPVRGTPGTVFIANEYFRDNNGQSVTSMNMDQIFATFAHETANLIDYGLNGSEYTYGYPNPTRDTDSGQAVENCMRDNGMFGG